MKLGILPKSLQKVSPALTDVEEERFNNRVLAFMQSTVDGHNDNRVNSSNSDWTACAPSCYLECYIYFLLYDNGTQDVQRFDPLAFFKYVWYIGCFIRT